MIVQIISTFKASNGKQLPTEVNGAPCIVDLPDAEARKAINTYKAKLTKGGKVNFQFEDKTEEKPKAK